ncbi:DsbE family thiol:disulfide interchange protein [Sphingomonas naphthae]|uniref:DsbE family thiol:disulfide interchange protein n=1 Tax=Sphingomonas naphthae TaxID=1813468 RepID=A0ABY7TLX2_9SPHN|nr:DsbE family thiol:disulfide interchange protein [Sphingomonas naphthae]WCT74227.1 DsbE family thiol:disulfide interchange protein [Sphingomonas naphthae]
MGLKRRLLIWLPLFAAAILLSLFAHGLRKEPGGPIASHLVGKPLPSFTLPPAAPGIPGLSSGDMKGRAYILNIFASWCVPCAVEAPQLAALKRAGVPIVAVAVRDKPADVADFLARYGNPYIRIGSDAASQLQITLGSSGVPESFVIGADGIIRHQHMGEIRADDVPSLVAAVGAAR